ncbi:MAG: DUF2281 domain-containing protein [Candidatus Aminicenantes bacterium]|jgi:hypothetical protein
MNKRTLLLEEINHMPENIVDEVIDFVQFLKGKINGEKKKTSTTGDREESWPEEYFSLFGALDEGDLVEPREIPFKHDSNRENL